MNRSKGFIGTCQWDGCSETFSIPYSTYNRKWCSQHRKDSLRKFASYKGKNPGSQKRSKSGYVIIKTDSGVWEGEHRIILSQEIGRPLNPGESVHHINGIRDDNRPENLELWVTSPRYGQRASEIICPHCKRSYLE